MTGRTALRAGLPGRLQQAPVGQPDQDRVQRPGFQVNLGAQVVAVTPPRRVNGQLYGSFLPGTPENLQRALTGLMEFLPSGGWFDHKDAVDPLETDASYPA